MVQSVKLPYGRAADRRLLHISEVESGLRCGCVCPKCGKKLVAKKGPRNAQHFSHHVETPTCQKAYETMLHLLAKQVIAERKFVWLPDGTHEYSGKIRNLFGRKRFRPTTVLLELGMDGMRPDIIARDDNLSKELLIEIYVTHRCEQKKIQLIRERRIAAIEIDLSKVSRSAPKEEMENAILSSAERIWLYNPKIAEDQERLREIARRRANEMRQLEKKLFDQKVDRMVAAFRNGSRREMLPVTNNLEAQMADLSDARLDGHVGIKSATSGCFAVDSTSWQAAVLHHFVMQEKMTRHFSLRDVWIFLRDSGFLLAPFREHIKPELAQAIRALEPSFVSPWQAAHRYLLALRSRSLLEYDSEGNAYQRQEIVREARSRVQTIRAYRQRIRDIKIRVGSLLSQVQNRPSVDIELWIRHTHSGYSKSPTELAEQGYGEYSKFSAHLGRLESMLRSGGLVEENLLGLPMERELSARKEEHRQAEEEKQRLAEEKAQKDDEDAILAARRRKLTLVHEAMFELGLKDGNNWTLKPLPCLGGQTLDARDGLTVTEQIYARRELRLEAAHQLRKAQRGECLEVVRNEAIASLGVEWADMWMKLNNSLLGNRKPVDVCVDALGLDECRKALRQFTRRGVRR